MTEHPPIVMTVSGSDASGRAGVQADNRAILSCGGFPLNVITALTLQGPDRVPSIDLSDPDLVRRHMSGLLKSYPVRAIKAGMLGSGPIVRILTETVSRHPEIPLVLDPVLQTTCGRSLLDEDGIREMKRGLLPKCDLVTPNLSELAHLTGRDAVSSPSEERDAAQKLIETGCQAVLVKGGHRKEDGPTDWLFTVDGAIEFSGQRVTTPNTGGTGCSLASAIAAGLAASRDLPTSIRQAKSMIQNNLELNRKDVWPGSGPALYEALESAKKEESRKRKE